MCHVGQVDVAPNGRQVNYVLLKHVWEPIMNNKLGDHCPVVPIYNILPACLFIFVLAKSMAFWLCVPYQTCLGSKSAQTNLVPGINLPYSSNIPG